MYIFLTILTVIITQARLAGQTAMRAASEQISHLGPLTAELVSSSEIRSYRFYNPFLLSILNTSGDQFGFDTSTNTLQFFIERMGSTNSREQILYLVFNNTDVDFIKATRQTTLYNETYTLRDPTVIPMPEHWRFDPLGDWIPYPFNKFLQRNALAYSLGTSDWSGRIEIEVKFKEEITENLLMSIIAVNPNRSARQLEELMRVPFSQMLNLVKYMGESTYSDYV